MSTTQHSKEPNMATTTRPTTTETQPTLPSNTYQWPAFDRNHDPEYLTTNDPVESETRTLADFGGIEPTDPDRPEIPIDTRDKTEQSRVFRYPRKWWTDAERLTHLFDTRDLSIGEISALFGDDIGYEVVRTNLNDLGVRDPTEGRTGTAAFLAKASPGDVGDPLPDAFN